MASIIGIITTAIIAGTIIFVIIGNTNSVFAYFLYAVSAIALIYLVYLIVYFAPKITKRTKGFMQKHKFTKNLLDNYGYRSIVFASISFAINVAYAMLLIYIAVKSGSAWFASLSGYYIMLSLIRGGLIANFKKEQKNAEQKQIKAYANCGALLVLLNMALVVSIIIMVRHNRAFEYAGLMIYVMATYAFYKLGLSIYNIFKAKKQKNFIIQAIKNLGFADALVSILALQTALLSAFASGDVAPFNALTGGAVSIVIITIGIIMFITGQKKIIKFKQEEQNGKEI